MTNHAEENANVITNCINMMGAEEALTGKYIATRHHRTLQQGFMRLVVGFIEAEAANYDNGYYDARNEATATLCKELMKTLLASDKGLPFI